MKIDGWERVHCAYSEHEKSGVAILVSDKINFQAQIIIKDKEGYFIMRKDINYQVDIMCMGNS